MATTDSADINLVRRAPINYTLVRGDSFAPPPVSFEIDDVPESFVGASLKMQVKAPNKRVAVTLEDGDGIGVASNVLQYSISAAEMEEWECGQYKYDVQKTVSGIVSTIQSGTITLLADQTE